MKPLSGWSAERERSFNMIGRDLGMRELLKRRVQQIIGWRLRTKPVREWPRWAADLFEMKIPMAVEPNPVRGPAGGANINILLDLLDRVRKVPGPIAECGVYRGATLLPMGLYVEQNGLDKFVYGFDSFAGFDHSIKIDLAIPSAFNDQKCEGGFRDTSLSDVQRRIDILGLQSRIKLIPGYFRDTLQLEESRHYSFAHLDCDIYESYSICLGYFYERMNPGGIILLDEYNDPPWPGCNRAVDEFTKKEHLELQPIEQDGYEKYFLQVE